VSERLAEDATTGATIRDEIVGPFGKIQEQFYRNGELQFVNSFRYDQNGNLVDLLTFDPEGKQEARMLLNVDEKGNNKEQWDWGKNDKLLLHYVQTYDPKTQVERFTSFNEYGSPRLSWTVIGGILSSYWQLPSEKPQYGDGFTEDAGLGTQRTYNCHSDSTCDVALVHYAYVDETRRNPRSVAWRDAVGNLILAAYYEYQFDPFGNWTQRKIWVWSAELGERQLYESDSRSLSYWSK
jgi:hypothetical protein